MEREQAIFWIADAIGRLTGRVSRREWLRLGGLSLGGVSLPNLIRSRTTAEGTPAKNGLSAVRKVVLCSSFPADRRSTKPGTQSPTPARTFVGRLIRLARSVPGLQVGELMPRLAAQAHVGCAACRANQGQCPFQQRLLHADRAAASAQEPGKRHFARRRTVAMPGRSRQPFAAAARGVSSRNYLARTHLEHGHDSLARSGRRLSRPRWDPWLVHCDPNEPGFQIAGIGSLPDVAAPRFDRRVSLSQALDRHTAR